MSEHHQLNRSISRSATIIVALHVLCASAFATPQLRFVGANAFPDSVNADGTAVAGYLAQPGGARAFRWTIAEGVQSLGANSGVGYSYGTGMSADGLTVAGTSFSANEVFTWSVAGGLSYINHDSFAIRSLQAYDLSDDGTVVAGYFDVPSSDEPRAFRWTAATGMISLGVLPGGHHSYANGVSADGLSLVGSASNSIATSRAFLWQAQRGMQDLGALPGGLSSYATACSSNGTVVVGSSRWYATTRAFRWTQEGGMLDIGALAPEGWSYALDVSGDGQVIVGNSGGTTISTNAFVWSPPTGMLDLRAYLESTGTDVSDWEFTHAVGVSTDGSALTGFGYYRGISAGWVITGFSIPSGGSAALPVLLGLYGWGRKYRGQALIALT